MRIETYEIDLDIMSPTENKVTRYVHNAGQFTTNSFKSERGNKKEIVKYLRGLSKIIHPCPNKINIQIEIIDL